MVSPTPRQESTWRITPASCYEQAVVRDASGEIVMEISRLYPLQLRTDSKVRREADAAELIVRAVNNHDALVKVLAALVHAATGDIYTDAPEYEARLDNLFAVMSRAEGVLKAARGKP